MPGRKGGGVYEEGKVAFGDSVAKKAESQFSTTIRKQNRGEETRGDIMGKKQIRE